jgi:hypothetical protein
MKKTFTILFAVLFSSFAFSQMDTIAAWTFPTDDLMDTIADISNDYNSNMAIRTIGGVSEITLKNGETTKAAQATNWELGENTKAWMVEINSTGVGNLMVSSMQTAGGSDPGPRDFILQYRIGTDGEWLPITGSEITVANDWTSGVLENIALPEDCNNQSILFLRWVMTSNLDINGVILLETGKAKIDNIFVTGELIDDIIEIDKNIAINIFPNPCTSHFTVEAEKEIQSVEIFNINGAKCMEVEINSLSHSIDIQNLKPGMYSVILNDKNGWIGSQLLMVY